MSQKLILMSSPEYFKVEYSINPWMVPGVAVDLELAKNQWNGLKRTIEEAGAEVKVVLTDSAMQFVTPLTLSTLSKNKVYCSFINDDESSKWNNHVELGIWADLMLIAPVSANTISKMVSSNSDNLLIATYLSSKCPVFFAPAMDLDMHKHPSVQNNIK